MVKLIQISGFYLSQDSTCFLHEIFSQVSREKCRGLSVVLHRCLPRGGKRGPLRGRCSDRCWIQNLASVVSSKTVESRMSAGGHPLRKEADHSTRPLFAPGGSSNETGRDDGGSRARGVSHCRPVAAIAAPTRHPARPPPPPCRRRSPRPLSCAAWSPRRACVCASAPPPWPSRRCLHCPAAVLSPSAESLASPPLLAGR